MTNLQVSNPRTLSAPLVRARVSPVAAMGVSAVALGMALQVNFGQYDPAAIAYLALAILAGWVGVVGIAGKREGTGGARPVLGMGLVLQFLILMCGNPMATLH